VNWRFINAAVRGTSHVRADLPCQDDCFVDVLSLGGNELLIAIVSDGAGSATHAKEGSGLVCESFVPAIEAWLEEGGTIDTLDREQVECWIQRMRIAIQMRASQTTCAMRDFACTVVAAIVGRQASAFFQIGDGAIVIGSMKVYEVIFWPDGGEYANMTYFVTDDDWAKHLHFELRAGSNDDVALLTDGLQRLALHFETRSVHEPFFTPMFQTLQSDVPDSELDTALVAFLDSAPVNERTDDDKSLVLATRRREAIDGAL
jgi:hypothetical protein